MIDFIDFLFFSLPPLSSSFFAYCQISEDGAIGGKKKGGGIGEE